MEKTSNLSIPEFAKMNYALKNTDYAFEIREQNGEWQKITPYLVKVNNNSTQNISESDPVQKSPMIYFTMGDKPVEIKIKWNNQIKKAKVHPLSYDTDVIVSDGVATLTITKPQNICVEINDQMYEMVYIFAGESNETLPKENSEGVHIIKTGLTSAPRVAYGGWKGGLSDMRIYDVALSAKEISDLYSGNGNIEYKFGWDFDTDFADKTGKSTEKLGEPQIADCGGRKALVLNGYEDAVSTGVSLNQFNNFSLSAWIWLDENGAGAVRGIFGEIFYVRSNGKLASNIGNWEFPYEGSKSITTGKWHHVALVKNGAQITAYLDGINCGTQEREESGNKNITIGATSIGKIIYVKSNEKLIFEPGAVFNGTVIVYGAENAEVSGFGIINSGNIQVAYSNKVSINNVIVNNSSTFNLSIQQSSNVNINDFKCFSSYGASDGINTKASKNIVVDGCFIRSNDDSISLYATSVNCIGSSDNYTVKNSVLISDAGHNILMGVHADSNSNDKITNFKAQNIDVVGSNSSNEWYQGVLAINAGDNCTVENVTFENIRIEDFRINQLFNVRVFKNGNYNKSPGREIKNVLFKNIIYKGNNAVKSVFCGYNPALKVSGVHFENVVLNGEKVLDKDNEYIYIGDFVENITFK